MAVPSGWTDDGTYLTAPNGRRVVLGFRWHILTHPWAADDWPIESEHYESVLDITNPQHGDGIIQHFRRSILAWNEDSSQVLVLWSGAIALAWQRRTHAAGHPTGSQESTPVAVPAIPVSSHSRDGGPSRAEIAESASYPPAAGSSVETSHPDGPGSVPAESASARRVSVGSYFWVERLIRREKQVQVLVHVFSNPRLLLGWMIMLIALLGCDLALWLISTHIDPHATLPLPLLALGTVALSSLFLLLNTLSPRRR